MSHDIKNWLEGIGLGKYADVLAENEVDLDALPLLSEEDFEKLGLLLGARRKLQAAIRQLPASSGPRPRDDTDSAAGEAERRQLTIMFCDLVGSTELAQRLDPEVLSEVNRAYQDACKAAIERYEGYVARYMGDGVLAYFGYPRAHEDDAERAIHAGLRMTESIPRLRNVALEEQAIELGVRVGIATGAVVVGDLIGEGASQESAVVGETPNLAHRLQGLAARNTVIVAPGTHDLVASRFEFEDLGEHSLKGIAEPVRAWRVIALMAAESRFEARQRAGLTPLVGREHEIELLLERWNQAVEGDGQVVLLCGEAGIGKSRIAETLRERIVDDHPTRLRYQCSPYHTNTALHPVIQQLERASRMADEDSNEVKLDKLEALLGRGTAGTEAVTPLLAALLSIPIEERYPPLGLTPERQKEQTLDALLGQLEGLSRGQPVLVIFEDVHWADPTSLELLELIIERAQSAPVLALLTYRPEFSAPWSSHTHVTSLTLNRFTRHLASTLVENVTGGKRLPDEVLEQIIDKADGIPLFVEELTKNRLESGTLREELDRYVATGPLSGLAIPNTLHDSLLARLDRSDTVKDVAQTAAVIGREFDYDLLASVSPFGAAKLRDALDQLIDAELVFRRGRASEGAYIFKHALVRDAAYGSLLRNKRQELHGRVARVLRDRFPERVASEPELLAHHLTGAGLFEAAVEQWKKAGLRAMDSSANTEAASHLAKALELFGRLEGAHRRPRDELSLQIPLGSTLSAVRGWSAPEAGRAYLRARELCRRIGNTSQTFPVLYGVWNHRFTGGHHRDALELAEELLNLAEKDGERTPLMAAHGALGQTLTAMGRLAAAREHIERSIDLYLPEEDDALWRDYGETPPLTALAHRGWVSWLRGFPEQALSQSHEAIETAQRASDMASIAAASFFGTWVRHSRRDLERAREMARATIGFCTEQSIPFLRIFATMLEGQSLLEEGSPERATALMESAVAEWKAAEMGVYRPWAYFCLARGHARCGHLDGGLRILDDAFEEAERSSDEFWLAELHRLRGNLLLARSVDDVPEAETSFRAAIEVAREQTAKSLELRAATDLARLYEKRGDQEEARNVLAPVYDWFTEGFETADLKEAKRLLQRVSASVPAGVPRIEL